MFETLLSLTLFLGSLCFAILLKSVFISNFLYNFLLPLIINFGQGVVNWGYYLDNHMKVIWSPNLYSIYLNRETLSLKLKLDVEISNSNICNKS